MNASAKDNTVCLSFSLVPGGLGKLQHEQKCGLGTTRVCGPAIQPMLQLIGSTVGMQNVSGSLNPGQARSIN
ncbi:TPA: hypothetical protein ACH3X3_004834 [Trebouxia sp. C0006]